MGVKAKKGWKESRNGEEDDEEEEEEEDTKAFSANAFSKHVQLQSFPKSTITSPCRPARPPARLSANPENGALAKQCAISSGRVRQAVPEAQEFIRRKQFNGQTYSGSRFIA